jgi:hypothetical protein
MEDNSMKPKVLLMLLLTCFAMPVWSQAQTENTITSFDVAGAGTGTYQGTYGVAINNTGAIAGYYLDSRNVYHGFLRAIDGSITTFDAPGAAMKSIRALSPTA